MEKEQLEKKVEWLDAERRKGLKTIADLETRLAALEETLNGKDKQSAKSSGNQTARVTALNTKVAELEKELKAYRSELKKDLQEAEKQHSAQEKSLQQEQKGLAKVLEDFRKEIGQLQALQKGLTTQGEKIERVTAKADSLQESIATVVDGEEKRARLARSLQESSKQDAKRLTEMHAEVASVLSKLEAATKRTELVLVSQRKVETRMEEVAVSEEARRAEQKAFVENSALAHDERQRVWKEWAKRFDLVEKQSAEIGARLKDIETTDLAMKRAQRAFDELVEKIDRRVNELGEIQRLGDQRFRQEWSTFQADAQKRWSNFTLSHEEQQRESTRQREKLAEQITQLEDNLRESQDILQHLNEQSERNLQTMLEMARDSLAENERFLGNPVRK
jgi:hypothetical protein